MSSRTLAELPLPACVCAFSPWFAGGKRKRPIRSFAKATESFQSYEQWGVQRGDKEGGLANYYDQVRDISMWQLGRDA